MPVNDITSVVIDICIEIHSTLGPGLFESIYEEILFRELNSFGFQTQRQVPIIAHWKGKTLPVAFKADLIILNSVILEIKSVKQVQEVHKKQLLTYLKLTEIRVGLLLNFNEELMKHGIRRIING
ncbi:GxxExxY protein [bacterium]|nr:GxxExxY protein [bacterium]